MRSREEARHCSVLPRALKRRLREEPGRKLARSQRSMSTLTNQKALLFTVQVGYPDRKPCHYRNPWRLPADAEPQSRVKTQPAIDLVSHRPEGVKAAW